MRSNAWQDLAIWTVPSPCWTVPERCIHRAGRVLSLRTADLSAPLEGSSHHLDVGELSAPAAPLPVRHDDAELAELAERLDHSRHAGPGAELLAHQICDTRSAEALSEMPGDNEIDCPGRLRASPEPSNHGPRAPRAYPSPADILLCAHTDRMCSDLGIRQEFYTDRGARVCYPTTDKVRPTPRYQGAKKNLFSGDLRGAASPA